LDQKARVEHYQEMLEEEALLSNKTPLFFNFLLLPKRMGCEARGKLDTGSRGR
jgi:hypothetical protein